ncbi:uncharacterized protein CC84DRAFT_297759 [Paraphaeosphaeria sporulosa]|uniref:Uncharacterized protein n=1 Tax=Paraphaeosphaeria sporulosa TaxID=1460663 RepID=A0A177C0D9_9PLEO|nr:uncharacterized protein CC84DRAFT_297759 [Paraphaeosphaeria sporulosa]OAG00359.1 hypothetical protein CC84DRAFT_297759 [Paraphaeosphaeria sporulosa]
MARKRHIFVWHCCACGQASNNIGVGHCIRCGHGRCAYCQTEKVQIRAAISVTRLKYCLYQTIDESTRSFGTARPTYSTVLRYRAPQQYHHSGSRTAAAVATAMAESFESLDHPSSEAGSIIDPHAWPGDLQAYGTCFPIAWTRLVSSRFG